MDHEEGLKRLRDVEIMKKTNDKEDNLTISILKILNEKPGNDYWIMGNLPDLYLRYDKLTLKWVRELLPRLKRLRLVSRNSKYEWSIRRSLLLELLIKDTEFIATDIDRALGIASSTTKTKLRELRKLGLIVEGHLKNGSVRVYESLLYNILIVNNKQKYM